MEVKVGIQSVPRELVHETESTAEEVERDLTAALTAKDGKGVFTLNTQKGGRVLIPAEKSSSAPTRRAGWDSATSFKGRGGVRLVPWVTIGRLECHHPSSR